MQEWGDLFTARINLAKMTTNVRSVGNLFS